MAGLILPFESHEPTLHPTSFVAPDATVIGRVKLGARSSIWYKSLLRGDVHDIAIGEDSNIQDGCVIHCNHNGNGTWIGNGVTVGHMVMLHDCRLENQSFVGMNAVILDGAVIEEGAMVAAGALVTPGKRVPTGELWAGQPAKFMRSLGEKDYALIEWTAAHYAELAVRHQRSQMADAAE